MPTSPAADITKALRQAVKEENVPQLRKLLLDPQPLYITYISAFAVPLEKAAKKGSITLVQIIVEAIKKRYQQDDSPEAAGILNRVIQLETTSNHVEMLKILYSARAELPVHQKCDLHALRSAALAGNLGAIEVILKANQYSPLPGDQLLLEAAVDPATKRLLLSATQGIRLSPTARQAAIEQLPAATQLAPLAAVAPARQLPVTPGSPAAAAMEPQQTLPATPDANALATMAQMMQMMQTMMKLPESSPSSRVDSSSGEMSPTAAISKPAL